MIFSPFLLLSFFLFATLCQHTMGFLSFDKHRDSTILRSTSSSTHDDTTQHLVLVGGGHAHVQVIKALHARPQHLRVTLIDSQASASYSGMVPGCIAGRYSHEETQLDLKSLAAWSGLEFVQDVVVDVDCDNRQVFLLGEEEPISFDVLSLDIGSTTRGLEDCPGAAKFTIPTRPIDKLVRRIQEMEDSSQKQQQLVVVGAGVAGLELSMATKGRWPNSKCLILDAADKLLPYEPDSVRQAVKDVLAEKGVVVRHQCRVDSIDENTIHLKDGSTIHYDRCIWATGAGAHRLARHLHLLRGLDCDEHGWIRVSPTLQSSSHPYIFAAGDCASIQGLGWSPPKAGVYAVRSGPVLIENLTSYLSSLRNSTKHTPLTKYEPQDDFLKLVVCGDGTALGFRFGLAMRGSWVFKLKDKIDKDFMELFNVKGKPKASKNGYDTSQYDEQNEEPIEMDPAIALNFLLRSDDHVDFRVVQRILKRMGGDKEYREAVQKAAASHKSRCGRHLNMTLSGGHTTVHI